MDKPKSSYKLGSRYQSHKFSHSEKIRGKKRYGSRLEKNVKKEKAKKLSTDIESNSISLGVDNRTLKAGRNNSSGSESSSSEDSFFQLVNAVSKSKHKNVSIISDESDLEEGDVEKHVDNILEHEQSMEENEVEVDNHSDIFDDDQSNSIVIQDDADDESEDPFNIHFQHDLSDELFDVVSSQPPNFVEHTQIWPTLGSLKIILPKLLDTSEKKIEINSTINIEETKSFAKPGVVPTLISKVDWSKLHLKPQIRSNILASNVNNTGLNLTEEPLNDLQKEIFSVINTYQDLYYTNRTLDNGEQIRFVYALHAINHALKTRLKVIHHNARLSNREGSETDIPDEFRDQGLTRPKVLILVPFRDSAFRIIEMMISILNLDKSGNVIKKKRFQEEFTGDEIAMPVKNRKPEDYERTFKGNTDDTFRIGISVTKKSLKLYADFYSADIIIASPLGLRVIVGAEGESERDFDFLASIEVLILDQADIFLMQNWDHVIHVLDHFHLQPKDSHGTNFARVRSWALNGWSRYYRQTLVFASHPLPQISSLVNRKCHNYRGKVCIINPVVTGSICQIVLQLPQVFHRLEGKSAVQCLDERFEVFIKKILPQYKESLMSHTVIYIPSYFDYVRLRNYFKKETISFTQICEYSKENKIARARDMFFHSEVHFMLYSERFHFFRRIHLKGIRHILFYQLPTFPNFYSEMCNFMQSLKKKSDTGEELNMSVSVLYSRFDAPQLAAVVGSSRASRMLSSDRPVHMFMTGE